MQREVIDGMDEKQVHMNDDVVGFIDPDHPQRKYYKCRYCGNPFWKPDAFRKKYCSIECQKKSHSASRPKKIKAPKQPITKICEWCGDEFNAKNNKQKYCCKECGYEGNKRLQRQQWAKDYISKKVKCKECGVEFMTECGNKHSVFCCQTCADKYERRKEHQCERHKAYMRSRKSIRERQIAKQTVGVVSYEVLYKRDKGICGICGLPIHKDKFIDDSWGGTIDHIVPISVGGEHGMANCQLAHRICNSLKCKDTEEYSIDWEKKSQENNYWKNKYETYKEVMGAG